MRSDYFLSGQLDRLMLADFFFNDLSNLADLAQPD